MSVTYKITKLHNFYYSILTHRQFSDNDMQASISVR